MTNTQTLDPTGWTTPKTASRAKRCITLPATWMPAVDGTVDWVNRIVSDDGLTATYEPAYQVAAGWGRIACEMEIEVADANQRRQWKIAGAAVAAIIRIPGYTELESD